MSTSWHNEGEYRNGFQTREVVTEHRPTAPRIPRGRLFDKDGSSRESHS